MIDCYPRMNITTIISVILILVIIIYIIQNIFPYFGVGIDKGIESFTSETAPGSGSFINSILDYYWYLGKEHDNGKNQLAPVIYRNGVSLPVIRYGYYASGSYDNLVGDYFRHHIYPIEQLPIITGLETIYQFINGDLDIAFINEELLARYINQDCKYLTRLIKENLGTPETNNPESTQLDINLLYPPINFSAIGVGYHKYFYLIVNNYANIIEFQDIEIPGKRIAILEDSYYIFMKLIAAYGMDLVSLVSKGNIIRVNDLDELIRNFQANQYDGIFAVMNPKNRQIVRMTRNIKCRYIHIQKRSGLDARKNLKNLIPDQQGSGNQGSKIDEGVPPPPDINRQAIYSKAVMADLQTENITETFNDLMRKYFHHATPYTVDLNKFHKSGNIYTYLETYATRMILVVRNDIPADRVEVITRNYIDELARMRDQIDREQFQPNLDNFSSTEFDYNELVSFDSVIPLSNGARKVYEKEGLITYAVDSQCKL